MVGMESATVKGGISTFFNQDHVRRSEIPSANVHASARALARLANLMANKGQNLEDKTQRLMSSSTYEKMHANPEKRHDAAMSSTNRNFFQGYPKYSQICQKFSQMQ